MTAKSVRPIKLLLAYMREHYMVYLLGALALVGADFFDVVATRSMGWIIDSFAKAQGGKADKSFYELVGLLIFSQIMMVFFRFGWRITLARQTHLAAGELINNIWRNARYFSKKQLAEEYSRGVLMNASTSDVSMAKSVYGFILVGLIDVPILVVIVSSTMFAIDSVMTLWILAVFMLAPYFIKKLSDVEMDRYRSAQETLSKFDDLASQSIATIRMQRLTQTGTYWTARLIKAADFFRRKRLRAIFTSLSFYPIMGGASFISFIVLFSIGISRVLSGAMTVGDFVAIQGLTFMLQNPLMEFGFVISDFRKGLTSLDRLQAISLAPKEEYLRGPGEMAVDTNTQEVLRFENLSYEIVDFKRKIFSNLSMTLARGDRLGIWGEIGRGKSTLLNVLSGNERSYQGAVYLGGKKIESYSHSALAEFVGIVPQRPFLFSDSIKNNIVLDRPYSEEKLWMALNLAGVDGDVRTFPSGIDTMLGEWGINLSGGQKQRLTLARALYRDPQLLFLDDCLSAVDTITEARILDNLDKHLKDTTLVWVAHRKSTLKKCNKFLEL
ncbi:MAG: hypothetical protein A2504_17490 [Bdellovibrionales bacterium RIFOXYD12_FULL_39_22]|nr:MAG: hypothetical protein A2385_10470 [Bdellovibrionales bacterium RIFOXYB1_FULL_39_21]OFZ40796.1 MAG: hypothetical protein A2485_17260 [Bdellovibrionales bacterium RIFOXYC12_FULL_39_17]OFZ48218.1 MAG: hypothetical protein A2404_17420 [Bdellovibrionales bacterium RIFOXYC1_FULL_39_130]OFZ75868.1 MAG: hypothetical protein A2560_13920 [Bdellovibrionales bacterium RIFOXYD1_FULL_39_84]OFZ91929.1 MAG: hypothetical protein A2504_17490 [Bdellovibrionales bacterium RIFOXYD12_FULL_39_22]HLE11442.1 AB